jgi:Family of unknown function (DUF6152)
LKTAAARLLQWLRLELVVHPGSVDYDSAACARCRTRAAKPAALMRRQFTMSHLPLSLAIAIALASAGTVVQAHHSIAAVYDTSRQVIVEGVVTEFRFVNPHPFLMIDVRDAAQKPQPWRLEIDNRWELVAIGVTAETWKAGDWIVVAGFPGRTQPHSLYVRTLDRPADGFRYEQVGSSPRIRPPSR